MISPRKAQRVNAIQLSKRLGHNIYTANKGITNSSPKNLKKLK
jgi:hypothetical protein